MASVWLRGDHCAGASRHCWRQYPCRVRDWVALSHFWYAATLSGMRGHRPGRWVQDCWDLLCSPRQLCGIHACPRGRR